MPTFEEQNRQQTLMQVRKKCQQEKRAHCKKPMHTCNVLGQVNLSHVEGQWSTLAHCVVYVINNSHNSKELGTVMAMVKEMGAETVMTRLRDTTHIISFGEDQRFINARRHKGILDI